MTDPRLLRLVDRMRAHDVLAALDHAAIAAGALAGILRKGFPEQWLHDTIDRVAWDIVGRMAGGDKPSRAQIGRQLVQWCQLAKPGATPEDAGGTVSAAEHAARTAQLERIYAAECRERRRRAVRPSQTDAQTRARLRALGVAFADTPAAARSPELEARFREAHDTAHDHAAAGDSDRRLGEALGGLGL